MGAHAQVSQECRKYIFLEANSASFLEAAKFVWRKGDPDQFAARVVAFLWRHGATVALERLLPDTLHS